MCIVPTILNMPLQVKLQLLHPDIIMQPSAAEIRKAVAGIMSRLHETSQPFVRWMDGTCLEAAPVAGMQPQQPAMQPCLTECCISSRCNIVGNPSACEGAAFQACLMQPWPGASRSLR